MTFDANSHLIPIKRGGPADYLPVQWRLVWLREDHPDAEIETRALEHEPGKWATFVARVAIPGAGSPTGHGSESAGDFRDYYEKAETKALGRALASLGYGTQFVGNELDEGERIVDSPVERPAPRPQPRPTPAAPAPSGPQPALDVDQVLTILGEMDEGKEPWHEIKRYADDQSATREGDDVLRIHDKLKAIVARRKGIKPPASIAG